MPRCNYMRDDEKQCGAMALRGEDKCLFHSQSEKAKNARAGKIEVTVEDMVKDAEKQYKKIKLDKNMSVAQKAKLMLAYQYRILQLKGVRITKLEEQPDGNNKESEEEEVTFAEKIKKAKERIDSGEGQQS